MAEYTSNALQSVAINSNVLFTDTVYSCGCVNHREGSGLFTLHGGNNYLILFSANASGATAGTEVDLALAVNGEAIPTSQMASTPAVADDLNSVSTSLFISVPCNCCYNLSVRNVGTTALSVANANLIVTREV